MSDTAPQDAPDATAHDRALAPLAATSSQSADEAKRLLTLRSLGLTDGPPLPGLDRLTKLASHVFGAPVSLATLVDASHQHFASAFGIERGDTPREDAFCTHALTLPEDAVMVVPDAARDARFAANPHVTDPPHIRFYAGAPIRIDGHTVGTLCVIDTEPRPGLSEEEMGRLVDFAALAADAMVQARETTLRREVQAHLLEERLRLDIALDAGGISAWEYDVATDRVRWHDRNRNVFGLDPSRSLNAQSYIDLVHPDDRDELVEDVRAVVEGRADEYRRVFRLDHPDGRTRWLVGAARPHDGPEGRRLIGVNYEITDERRLLEEREIAARELRHRIKNLIAVVTSLAAGSARGASSVEAFMAVFRGRLMALARGQDALLLRGRETTALADVCWDALRPFRGEGETLRLEADDGELPADQIQNVNMVLHELATNAVKHGALGAGGRVRVAAAIDASAVTLVWEETGAAGAGGPPSTPSGFGTLLIDRTVTAAGGTLERDWRPEGLHLTARLPLATKPPSRPSATGASPA